MSSRIALICILFTSVIVKSYCILNVSDDDLLQLIKNKEKLVVLFTKPNCEPCLKLENALKIIEDDFKEHLSAETVISSNSQLAKLYSPTKEPAVVFFRHGIPLLYQGQPSEVDIFNFFESNQQPAVKELTDNIFEHMTQAATGATTGDWFVMFYGAACVECQRLHAVWESVGSILRNRVNVARIDANLGGKNTAKRFKVKEFPTFLFFRLGKVYKYELPKNEVKSFVSFAQEWYKNVKANPVPHPATPFDELVDLSIEWLNYLWDIFMLFIQQYPWLWKLVLTGFGLVFLTSIIAVLKTRQRSEEKSTKKDKKKK